MPKSVLRAVLGRMQFTFHATRRTPHRASRLVQAISAWLMKIQRAPSRHSRDARVYGHTTTATHKLSTPPPHPHPSNSPQAHVISCRGVHDPRVVRAKRHPPVQNFHLHLPNLPRNNIPAATATAATTGTATSNREVLHKPLQQRALPAADGSHDDREAASHLGVNLLEARLPCGDRSYGNGRGRKWCAGMRETR